MTPAAFEQPVPEPSQKTPRRRIRGSANTWISASAVFVSLFSLYRSNQADKKAEEAQKRDRATTASFFWQASLRPQPKLYIINRSRFDIKKAQIIFKDGNYLEAGLIPACAFYVLSGTQPDWTANLPARLHFVDANDDHWAHVNGRLEHVKSNQEPNGKDITYEYAGNVDLQFLTSC
ncbi:hypothetical protein [Streptomyces sp. NPDC001435]|uniref:hypothetical protein n=1 Tax=Streptomyces sp. NPDC001435 TaxID=3364576 RepID=UPI00368417E5